MSRVAYIFSNAHESYRSSVLDNIRHSPAIFVFIAAMVVARDFFLG